MSKSNELRIQQNLANNVLPAVGFVRLPAVLSLIPVSRATWWAGIQQGRFPRGIKLGPRLTGWRVEDIRQLIERLGKEGAA